MQKTGSPIQANQLPETYEVVFRSGVNRKGYLCGLFLEIAVKIFLPGTFFLLFSGQNSASQPFEPVHFFCRKGNAGYVAGKEIQLLFFQQGSING